MALNTPAIATAIAALSVSGVTMKNITNIPKAIRKDDCPIFFPHPDEWFVNTVSSPDADFVGQATVYDAVRTFRYIYLHGLSTAGNPIADVYPAMAAKVDLLYSAIAAFSVNGIVMQSISISRFGEIVAPVNGTAQTRNVFFGCFFDFQVLEMSTS
jgi:hypothetical protein